MVDMKRTKPTGHLDYAKVVVYKLMGMEERDKVTKYIALDPLGDPTQANLPSVHLRYGLQIMRERGWSGEGWGDFCGGGPDCILEPIRSPLDSQGAFALVTPRHHTIPQTSTIH